MRAIFVPLKQALCNPTLEFLNPAKVYIGHFEICIRKTYIFLLWLVTSTLFIQPNSSDGIQTESEIDRWFELYLPTSLVRTPPLTKVTYT